MRAHGPRRGFCLCRATLRPGLWADFLPLLSHSQSSIPCTLWLLDSSSSFRSMELSHFSASLCHLQCPMGPHDYLACTQIGQDKSQVCQDRT